MNEEIRILCVDDEENILKAIQRGLRKKFHFSMATSGAEGLKILAQEPHQVVVSDMRMPNMDGAEFLKRVRAKYPDTVRLLLTGYADLDTVVSAVNEGNIYRFIAKPCTAGVLLEAFQAATRQYELMTAEKVLLEQTLRGSIHALTEVLSMSNPAAFGRGARIRKLADEMGRELEVADPWKLEVAAMVSQIGSITVPDSVLAKWYNGDELSLPEQMMIERLPEMTRNVLGGIPRLDDVLEILDYQAKNWDGTGYPEDKVAGEDIPLGSRILKVASICEEMQGHGETPGRILDALRAKKGVYDPDVIEAFQKVASRDDGKATARGVGIEDLRTGMIFTEEVKSKSGVLLVAAGQEVTISLLERIHNYEKTIGLKIPLWVMNPEHEEDKDADEAKAKAKEEEVVIGEK